MIYRSVLITLIFGLASLIALAQGPAAVTENWHTFQPENEEFSIEIPTHLNGPIEVKMTQNGPDDTRGSSMVSIFMFFLTRSKSPITSAWCRSSLSSARQVLETAKPMHLAFKDQFGYFQNISTWRTDRRIYIAQAVSLYENDHVANRFISSFSPIGDILKGDSISHPLIDKTNAEEVKLPMPSDNPQTRASSDPASDSAPSDVVGSGKRRLRDGIW